jgi:hypothetical protein
LSQLLTILKQQKESIDISNQEATKARVEDFVNQKFLDTDNLVEMKQADNETISQCLNIAYLIDVLEAVDALNDLWINRRIFSQPKNPGKYIKHRAIQLSKNLKTYGDVNGPPESQAPVQQQPSPQNRNQGMQNQNQYQPQYNATKPVQNQMAPTPPTMHGNTGGVYQSNFNSTNLETNLIST